MAIDDQDQESEDSDRQDDQVEECPDESENESEDSCQDPPHMMSTLSPKFFGDLLTPEVVYH